MLKLVSIDLQRGFTDYAKGKVFLFLKMCFPF